MKRPKETGDDSTIELETVRRLIVLGLPCAPIFSRHWTIDTIMRLQAPLPELRNSDGEAIVFCEVRFPIAGDEAKVAAVLDGIEAFEREEDSEAHWFWLAPDSPFDRVDGDGEDPPTAEAEDIIRVTSLGDAALRSGALVLTVNSRERAKRGRDLLASRLGDLVGNPLISHQDPEQAMAEYTGQPEDELGLTARRGGADHPCLLRRAFPPHPGRAASHTGRQDTAAGRGDAGEPRTGDRLAQTAGEHGAPPRRTTG